MHSYLVAVRSKLTHTLTSHINCSSIYQHVCTRTVANKRFNDNRIVIEFCFFISTYKCERHFCEMKYYILVSFFCKRYFYESRLSQIIILKIIMVSMANLITALFSCHYADMTFYLKGYLKPKGAILL